MSLFAICSCSVLNTTISHSVFTELNHDMVGSLECHKYSCSVNGPTKRYMYVYLPDSYYNSGKKYPVIYLLHGANGNETSWIIKGKITRIIDSLLVNSGIPECIYVFPNMNHYFNDYDYGQSREKGSIDSFLGLDGSVEYGFINDVVGYVDSHFRTIAEKKYRALAGLSLGGLQTIYISSNNWEDFEYIGLFSPLIYPPFKIGKYIHVYNDLEKKLKLQFKNPPSAYWIMVGKDDPYFNSSYFYSKLLQQNDHPHILYISKGGHTWDNWRQYCIMFIKELWRE